MTTTPKSLGRLSGKVAFITGAGGGIGSAHALRLAEDGADIVLFDLGDEAAGDAGYRLSSSSDLERVAEAVRRLGRRAMITTGDVRKRADLDAAIQLAIADFGQVDIAVANAGVARMAPTWETSEEHWELMLATNLTGTWNTCSAVIPHMLEREYGRVILTGSGSLFVSLPGLAGYSAAKAGVVALGKVLAAEVGDSGIAVNIVTPSTVATGMNKGLAELAGVSQESMTGGLSRARQMIPRQLDAVELSNAVAFLASDEAGMITGVTLPVDGGVSAS